MKNIAENFKNLFETAPSGTSGTERNVGMRINIITSRRGIGKTLFESKETGKVVGVYSPALGEGMLLLGVHDVDANHSDPLIIFENYDLNGIRLQRNAIPLNEIRSVCPFDSGYEDPFAKKQPAKQPVLVY